MSATRRSSAALEALWAHHNAELRDPHQVVIQWQPPAEINPQLLHYRVRGRWWEALAATGCTLFVTREYEHLVVGLSAAGPRPRLSYLRLPHPNGLAVDAAGGRVFIASTRNPNVVFEFAPCRGLVPRNGSNGEAAPPVLLPVGCRYLPGCLYIHDLALVGGRLYANAVALNAVAELPPGGEFRPAWWPKCIDAPGGPRFDRNYLQLNSIAAGRDLRSSFFSASAAGPSARRPGHLNFPVDKRGVIFAGDTREVMATGLTRPHSARLFGGEVWVDNSGYGEVGRIVGGRFESVARLSGWTRGLCRHGRTAFVATSRVIPRFRHYAPGLDCDKSETGVHALDLDTGAVVGSIVWPRGNQVFGLELVPATVTVGFPFAGGGRGAARRVQRVFFQGTPSPSS